MQLENVDSTDISGTSVSVQVLADAITRLELRLTFLLKISIILTLIASAACGKTSVILNSFQTGKVTSTLLFQYVVTMSPRRDDDIQNTELLTFIANEQLASSGRSISILSTGLEVVNQSSGNTGDA